MTVGELGNGSL